MIGSARKEFEINGIEYIAKANVREMYQAEKIGGRPFINIVIDTQKGFLEPFVVLMASCVSIKGEKESLGLDYVCDLEKETFEKFLEPVLEVVVEALPKEDKKKKK